MKQCPRCNKTYSDDELNFCLEDGELLSGHVKTPTQYADDSPPTVMLNEARRTNPTNWPVSPPSAPPVHWQQQQINTPQAQFAPYTIGRSRNQTLPTVSMILGIFSLLLICCYGGLWLGLPALIVGVIGMRQADNMPDLYTGRGMAIAGIVMGTVSMLAGVLMILLGIAGSLG